MTNQITVWFSAYILRRKHNVRANFVFASAIYSAVMIMESELNSVVSAAVQSLGYDVVKPEQEIALLSFLRGQDVFVSLTTGQKFVLRCLTCCVRLVKEPTRQEHCYRSFSFNSYDRKHFRHKKSILSPSTSASSTTKFSLSRTVLRISLHTGTKCLVVALESCLLYDPITRLVPQPRQKDAALVDIATHKASR